MDFIHIRSVDELCRNADVAGARNPKIPPANSAVLNVIIK
jgi:hypothetical protein